MHMDNILQILTIATSILAVSVSYIVGYNSKRKATADITTANRMEWIKTVRDYCADFIIEFEKESPDLEILNSLYVKIQLYGYGDVYLSFFESLKSCIMFVKGHDDDETVKENLSKSVLKESQEVLNGVWWRVKKEAGVTDRENRRIYKQYNKKYPKDNRD